MEDNFVKKKDLKEEKSVISVDQVIIKSDSNLFNIKPRVSNLRYNWRFNFTVKNRNGLLSRSPIRNDKSRRRNQLFNK